MQQPFTTSSIFRHNGIARQMIVALILFSTVITTIITTIELLVDYQHDISSIEKRFEFIGESYLPTLRESVWVADDIQITTQLDGLSRLQDIEALSISVNQLTRWQVGTIQSESILTKDVPIIRSYQRQELEIGTLHIVASVDNVLQRLWSKFIAVLISNGIKTLLVSAFMLMLFQFLVGQHLEHIANYLRNIGNKPESSPGLILNRADTGRWRPDALDQVSDSINQMHADVQLHTKEILLLNEQLEQRVSRRTEELEKANRKLSKTLNELELSSQAKSTFLSRVSHELRTPLNAICGFSQLLKMEPIDEQQNEYVDWIFKSGDHLSCLINDLLDLSRIEIHELPLEIMPVSVNVAIDNATNMTEFKRSQKNIHLINECSDEFFVSADITRLSQIIINLMMNAIKYIQEDGEIRTSCSLINDDTVRFSIADNGPGIARDKQAMIFSPFERLGAEDTEIEGTGTGLALSRSLAEAMGGALGFESEAGKGACFRLDLKRAEESEQEKIKSSTSNAQSAASDHVVLYVEDNPANQNLVKSIFRYHSGYDLHLASDGIIGLEQAKTLLPDLILLDIQLPGINGYDVLKQL
ncbi:MAG: ATP-binding protein, partial [Gammaproteobacteria bacterium]|nr:ATP-binding protein [Gammaproteobacteria bacterium]